MRITILAHSLCVAGGLAVGKNFIKMLKRVSPEHTYLIVVPDKPEYENIELPKNGTFVVYKGNKTPIGRIMYDNIVLPNIIHDFSADVVFGMANTGLNKLSAKQAVLVQDSHMLYDENHYKDEIFLNKFKWRYQKYQMKHRLDHIDLIFCQTPVTKQRFAKVFHYPAENIKLMPNAVSRFDQLLQSKIGVPDILKDKLYFNFFYLARYYAHKNFEILIDLFRKYSDKLKGVRCIITITSEQHKHAPRFLSEIRKYKLDDKIINIGPLKQEQLVGYFLHCNGLLFPTLLESFSGTYLEAMHFGLPILTSDLDFAHYICGDAAIYFNPWDASDIAQKMVDLKDRPHLREELIGKGKQRISKYNKTWEEVTADVIEKLEQLHQDR